MKRLVGGLLSIYLALALGSKLLERSGRMLCACSDDCWCKRSGLSVFRWVFPKWHQVLRD